MIEFEEIIIEGFGSMLGPIKYPLGKNGINIIMGINGAGKTTIFSGLSWALFGKPLKNIKSIHPWPWIIDDNYLGTKVEVRFIKFKDKYRVIRCLDYKGEIEGSRGKDRLILIINGVVSKIRDKKDIQREVERVLGYTFDLFKHSILFGQKLTRLISEKGPDKKKLFDEAFEVAFINIAKTNSEKERVILEKDLQKIKPKYDQLKVKLDSSRVAKKREVELQKNWSEEIEAKKKSITQKRKKIREELDKCNEAEFKILGQEKKLVDLKTELTKLNSKLSDYNNADKNLFPLEMQLTQEEGELSSLQKESKRLMADKAKPNKLCPRCEQTLNKELRVLENKKLNQDLKVKKKQIIVICTKIQKLKTQINGYKEIVDSNKKFKEKEYTLKIQINLLEKEVSSLEYYINNKSKFNKESFDLDNEWVSLTKQIPDFITKKKEAIKNIKQIKEELKPLKRELGRVNHGIQILNWLIEDPLSNKGLKAYIFNSMLDLVNKNLEQYANFLGYNIIFYIDMESASKNFEVKIIKGNHEIFYEELSGGQGQLVDVSMAFAIHDTVTVNRGCNLLILDEVFESLSADNIEAVVDLIKMKAKNLSLHLVTHREEFNLRSSKVTRFKLIKGVTHLV